MKTPRTRALAATLTALALAACQRPTPAPAPPAAGSPPAGPSEARPFEVALVAPAGVRSGQPASARVVVTARGGFHVNRDYPMAFRPEPAWAGAFGGEKVPLGAQAERTPCAGQPEEACAVSAPLPFTLAAPGAATLAGTVAFSVCNAEICLIEKAPLSMAVTAR
jgi:hypothetical protein